MFAYDSIGQVCITAEVESDLPVKSICVYDDMNYAIAASEGDNIQGVLVARHKDRGTIQVRGFVTVPFTGTTTPHVGFCPLVAAANGAGVKVQTGEKEYLVTELDNTAKTVTFML